MTDYTPEQLEWAARLLCVASGQDPDEHSADGHGVLWRRKPYMDGARRLLDELARQGVKALPATITREMDAAAKEHDFGLACNQWEVMHAHAPICPDADR